MKTLSTSDLLKLDTKAGTKSHAAGIEPLWQEADVVIRYLNAFDKEIVAVFTVAFTPTANGAVLAAFGITTLEFAAPSEWADKSLVPFEAYLGQHDELPAAGLGGSFGIVRQYGNGAAVLTAPLNTLAAAARDEAAKKIEL